MEDVVDLEKIQDILDTIASTNNEVIMKFLKERGFEFKIDPYASNEFGVASVLSVLVEWYSKHKEWPIHIGDKKYSGVMAKEDYEVFKAPTHEHPVVMLKTKSDEKVYLTIADKEYEHLELIARIKDINDNLKPNYNYKNAIFPMVDLDQSVDISWVKGILVKDNADNDWIVADAKQKTRFKMNHIGAKAESAVVMRMRCTSANISTKPPVIIDKPFFVWMTRPDLHDPLFMGYVDEEDWEDPGDFHGEDK